MGRGPANAQYLLFYNLKNKNFLTHRSGEFPEEGRGLAAMDKNLKTGPK
jgi:hypothetical protein